MIVVPDFPLAENALERPVPHRPFQNLVDGVAKRGVGWREHANIVAGRHAVRLDDEAGKDLSPAFRQDVVEQDGVEAAEHQVAVRMHVVVVRDGRQAMLAFGAQQDLVRDRAAQGTDPAASQVTERVIAGRIGIAHGEHFAERVIGNRRSER